MQPLRRARHGGVRRRLLLEGNHPAPVTTITWRLEPSSGGQGRTTKKQQVNNMIKLSYVALEVDRSSQWSPVSTQVHPIRVGYDVSTGRFWSSFLWCWFSADGRERTSRCRNRDAETVGGKKHRPWHSRGDRADDLRATSIQLNRSHEWTQSGRCRNGYRNRGEWRSFVSANSSALPTCTSQVASLWLLEKLTNGGLISFRLAWVAQGSHNPGS